MWRCIVCRTRRATFAALLKHVAESGHRRPCTCGGYHFVHRPGSPLCDSNPYVRTNRALHEKAAAEDALEAFIEDALFNRHQPSKGQQCPF